jgi:hypothetical protein
MSHPFFTFGIRPEVQMKSRKLSKIARAIYEKRTAVVYIMLAFIFSGLLRSGDQFTTLLVA